MPRSRRPPPGRRPPARRHPRRRRRPLTSAERAAAIATLAVALILVNLLLGPWVDFGGDPATDETVAERTGNPPAGEPPAEAPPQHAKAIVEKAVAIAAPFGTYVCSHHRPGERLASGELSDHAGNDAARAARDISVRGINCLSGPPPPNLDEAAVAIGKYFGRTYALGAAVEADTFRWNGHRIQIIWRTPKWGDHRGHIHIGACRC